MLTKLIIRNSFRHKLRTALTIVVMGLVLAAFGLVRTFVDAWYSGVDGASPNRLITRHAVSLIMTLPLSYHDQLQKIAGVEQVTYANWFGGVYDKPENFFAQFAVEHGAYFDLFPEFEISSEAMASFKSNIKGVIIGHKLADRFGWEVGERVTLIGTIYPGNWDFDIVGIYRANRPNIDEASWFMRWDYLDETVKKQMPGRDGEVGWYALKVSDPRLSAEISTQVDSHFKNSSAETLTETEKAFQLGFVEMSGSLVLMLTVFSWLIVGVILMVLVNTMAMSARERLSEYAYMKSMGFRSFHFFGMIIGESMVIALMGAVVGLALLPPIVTLIRTVLGQYFTVFEVQPLTLFLIVVLAIAIGLIAATFPSRRASKIRIVDGLRVVD